MSEQSELEMFEESIKDKSANTKKSYLRAYRKLRDALGKDIHHISQKKIIEYVDTNFENLNTQAQLINVGILVRRLYKYDTKELEAQRDLNKKTIMKCTQQNNTLLDLPVLQALDDHIEGLYDGNRWREYIINYLIRNCYVRNEDVLFSIVKRKREAKANENYMWLQAKKATYFRKVYKTADTYGMKTNIITDPKFILALKRVDQLLIPNPSQVGYYVKKLSYNSLGEGALLKMIVNHHRGDISKLQEITESRGTAVLTLLTSYNINK